MINYEHKFRGMLLKSTMTVRVDSINDFLVFRFYIYRVFLYILQKAISVLTRRKLQSRFYQRFHGLLSLILMKWKLCRVKSGVFHRYIQNGYEAPKIRAVGLSYDKTMAAVAQRNGAINVISVPLLELWQYSTEYKSISCCTFAPDDSFVLFGKLETVLSIAERKEVPLFHGNNEIFTLCTFSPHGKRLVTSDGSSTVKLWDVAKQSLLSSLCADVPVNRCFFSSIGLFIIGDWIDGLHDYHAIGDSEFAAEYNDSEDCEFQEQGAFCVWYAITWQRSDERNLSDVERDEGKVIHSKLCHRCFRPGFKELNACKKLEIEPYTYRRDGRHGHPGSTMV